MNIQITLVNQNININNINSSAFVIEPISLNQGITLGNTLRRILLNDLSSFRITGFRINNLKHQFSNIEGLKEDILEVILNLKDVIFKSSFFNKNSKHKKLTAILKTKGPKILTAGMFKIPKNILKIVNPTQYIGTLTNDSNFILEVDIECNSGYLLIEDLKLQKENIIIEPHTFLIDVNFNPIISVNYKIQLIHDIQGNLKESLFLEITTNGSITPNRSLKEAIKIIINLFYPLLFNKIPNN